MRSTPQLLDPATHRLTVLAHLSRCAPCRELLALANDRGDLDALARWRVQIAAHLDSDRGRSEHEVHLRRGLPGGAR